MSRRPAVDWPALRTRYEAGESVIRLAQLCCVKAQTIRDRAATEAWGPNASENEYRERQALRQARLEKRLAAAGALHAMPAAEREALLASLLRRYLDGEMPAALARELGATPAALTYAMLGGLQGSAYDDLITQALTARVAAADAMLADAKTAVEVNKATQTARFARQDLERVKPHLYGQQKRLELYAPGGHDLGKHLRLAQEEAWDARLRRARERLQVHDVQEAEVVETLPRPQGGA